MIHSFRKFFEFAGRQSRNWYLGLFYEIIRCILEALQFAALLVVLDGLVHDNITAQTALLSLQLSFHLYWEYWAASRSCCS